MKNRTSNELALREKLIREHLRTSNVVPSPRFSKYLSRLDIEENKKGLLVNEVAIEKIFRNARESSSVSKYRETCYNLKSDLETSLNRLEAFKERITTQHKAFIGSFNNIYSKIKINIGEANRQLLLNMRADRFVYGITETFENFNNIDLVNSTTGFLGNKICLGFELQDEEQFSLSEIDIAAYCKNGYLNEVESLNSKNNILEKDGSSFKYIAYTNSSSSIVDLEFTMNLKDNENIDKLLVVLNNLEVNDKCNINTYYSLDGVTYESCFNNNIRAQDGGNYFDIYKERVSKIKVKISKFSYDFIKNGQYAYYFYVDFIGKANFKHTSQSTFLTKAYEIKDEDGEGVDFSLATIKTGTCCLKPDGTSIDFYLSKDNLRWIPVSEDSSGNNIVEFQRSINNEVFTSTSESGYIPYYIPNTVDYIEGSIKFLRNYGGWGSKNGKKFTTLNISNSEGKYIDLENKNCHIDGELRTGVVYLSTGEHLIEISSSEYQTMDLNSNDLNLRYLFEGYTYDINYREEKKYLKLGEIYESSLKSVSEERFLNETSNRNIYCKIINDNGVYFKAHDINSNEVFIPEVRTNQDRDNNKLYIKAILNGTEEISPVIDQIQVRVI